MTKRAWLYFTLSSVIWGVPYLFIKVAVDGGLAPSFVAWSRIVLGAAVLVPIGWRKMRGLHGRAAAILGYTACETAVPFVLTAMGERYITSSLTAILISTMPLMVAILSLRLLPGDRLTGKRLTGLIVGFGGVVALLGVDLGGRAHELLGAGLVLGATLCYAIAPIIVSRRLADLDPLGPVTASLLIGSVALLPAGIAAFPNRLPAPAALWSIAVLGVICTALGLVIFFRLIAEAGASRASVITYVNPLVAVVVGVVALHERLGVASLMGLVLILVGSWFSTGGSASPHQAVAAEPMTAE